MNQNSIGIISMFYARPFTREHFSLLPRVKAAGCDFIELLVPEPGELDLAETRRALADNGLGVLLAARVNLTRDLASADAGAHAAGVSYLENCVEVASTLGAGIVGGPLYGAPLVFAGRAPAPVAEGERRRRIDAIVGGLKQAGRAAQGAGVKFAIEALNRFETDIANTTGHALTSALSLLKPGGGAVRIDCAIGAEDEPGTCETPRQRTDGEPGGYEAVAEFAREAEDAAADGAALLLRAGSGSARS